MMRSILNAFPAIAAMLELARFDAAGPVVVTAFSLASAVIGSLTVEGGCALGFGPMPATLTLLLGGLALGGAKTALRNGAA